MLELMNTNEFNIKAAHLIVDYLLKMPTQIIYCDPNHDIVSYNADPVSQLPAEVGRVSGADYDGSIAVAVASFIDSRPWFVVPEFYTRILAFRLIYFEPTSTKMEIAIHEFV